MEPKTFTDYLQDEKILKAIQEMNYVTMTPVQAETYPLIDAGQDVIAQSPTGTGKTGAYALPLLGKIDPEDDRVQMLVVCPTRELAVQSLEEMFKFSKYKEGIRAMVIYGGQDIEKQILTLKKHPQIVIGTPGRIMDHQRRGTLKLQHLRFLVLDEADEMLRMGFKEDVDAILKDVISEHQTMLFSATLPPEILRISDQYLKSPKRIMIAQPNIQTQSIKQYYLDVKEKDKEELLRRIIDAKGYSISMVFCRTKHGVDELALSLQSQGLNVAALHGDLKQVQRTRVMHRFKQGEIKVLIATDVAARGLDINDVEAVFNYDPTEDAEFYLHRIGRTGRASKKGEAYSFLTRKDKSMLPQYEKMTKSTIERIDPPSEEEARARRINEYWKKIQPVLVDGRFNDYLPYLEEFANAMQQEGQQFFKPQEIAAAFLAYEMGKKPQKLTLLGDDKSERDSDRGDMVRLFINLGKKDGMDDSELARLFEKQVGVKRSQLKDIFLLDSYSFVELPREFQEAVMKTLNGADYQGRTIAIEEAERRERKRTRGPAKSYGDHKPSGEGRSYSPRKSYGEGKPYGENKPYGERKSYGEGKPYSERKSYGEAKPYGERSFGENKPYGERSFGGESKPYSGESKPFGDRRPRKDARPYESREGYADKKKSSEYAPKRREYTRKNSD